MEFAISSGVIRSRQKVVVYGPEGIGKSTFAAQFPKPLFIDTEGSTKKLDVNRFRDKPTSWSMLKNYVEYVKQNPGICETLVIDTIDWAERLCVDSILASHGKKGIEDFGYGNGYTYVAEEIGRFLNLLQELIDKDICNVVLTAHSQIKHFEQPDESGSYDRYELKLGKKTTSQTSPLVKEWADMILFANYETFAVAADKEGKKFKGQGGQRVMYTSHHPCWDAKNRDGLPPKLPFDYSEIAHIITGNSEVDKTNISYGSEPENTVKEISKSNTEKSEQPAKIAAPKAKPEPVPEKPVAVSAPETTPEKKPAPPSYMADFEEVVTQADIPPGIPDKLRDLMIANSVTEDDIRFVVAEKGYFPGRMPVADYPPEFIEGVLVGAWEQVYAMIKENKKLPF